LCRAPRGSFSSSRLYTFYYSSGEVDPVGKRLQSGEQVAEAQVVDDLLVKATRTSLLPCPNRKSIVAFLPLILATSHVSSEVRFGEH